MYGERHNACLYIYTHTNIHTCIYLKRENFLDLANIQVLFKLSNLHNLVLKKSALVKQYKKANSDI